MSGSAMQVAQSGSRGRVPLREPDVVPALSTIADLAREQGLDVVDECLTRILHELASHSCSERAFERTAGPSPAL